MKKRTLIPVVAALFTAFILPDESFGQFAKNTNQSRKLRSVLVGGSGNLIGSNVVGAFIGGGGGNTVSNRPGGFGALVGGGFDNLSAGRGAVVAGGEANVATNDFATVGGGVLNTASATIATVGGGFDNEASGNSATVGGGRTNTASGNFATVPGGVRGEAINNGSFVWSGDSSEVTTSFADNTFTVRCEGGARFYTANGTAVGPRLAAGGSDWVANSDSNLKTKVTAVDARAILSKLSQLPVTEWQYKHNPDRRYIGPMAQDFHAMFGLGDDDKGIGTLDSDGVMYAAIQGLVEELKERDKTIEELKAQNAEVQSALRAIREQLSHLPPP